MRIAVIGSLLLICCASFVAVAQAPHRVVSADQPWQIKDGRRLLRGSEIAPKSVLVADGVGDIIVACTDAMQMYYGCAGGKCEVEACAAAGTNVKARPINVGWRSLLTREPRQPVMAAARAGGDPNDAVLLLDSRGLHLGPALMRVLEGNYCFVLNPLTVTSAGTPKTVILDWDRAIDAEGIAAASGVTPGLYRLVKGIPTAGGTCETDKEGVPAWVLLTTAPDFASATASWKSQSDVAADLERNGASRATVSTIRHAALAGLAEPTAGK